MNAQESLPGDDFEYYGGAEDIEKVDFPSNEKPIPTYSAAFGSGQEVPPPSQMFPARLGPRFFNRSAEPFDTPSDKSPVSPPPAALMRNVSGGSSHTTASVVRSDTRGSTGSTGSVPSYYSYSRSDSGHSRNESQQPKRWVIE